MKNNNRIIHTMQTTHKKWGEKITTTLQLVGVPGTITISQDKQPLALPDQNFLDEIRKALVSPISQAVVSYRPQNGIGRPQVKLVFDPTMEAQTNGENQKIDMPADDDFILEQPRYNLSNVVLPESTMCDLEATLALIKNHDLIYNTWNLKSVMATGRAITINFWGKPGTGKTLCAEAISGTLGKKIIKVNYADLESKYVGDTSKNITRLFRFASERDVVLFFDEADSILGKRLNSVTQSADHAVNMSRSVMLIELEKFDGIVIFASNLIKNYDPAFARRLLHQIEFVLPDKPARVKIFSLHLPKELPLEKDVTADWLASETEGFSGGDIRNLVLKIAARAAASPGPDSDKKVKREYAFMEIDAVRRAKTEIEGNPWMVKKMKEKLGEK